MEFREVIPWPKRREVEFRSRIGKRIAVMRLTANAKKESAGD